MTGDLLDLILSLERRVWDALVAGDAVADAALLAKGFLGVYPSGLAGREDHVAQLAAGPTVAAYCLSDAQLRLMGEDHGLLVYRADYRRSGGATDEAMFISSIWQRRPGGWVNLFSQDTPVTGYPVP